MPRIAKISACAFFLLLIPLSGRAAQIPRPDLARSCFLSTDIVEARLTRTHRAGTPEWADTFSAAVLRPVVGAYVSGRRIRIPLADDLSLYDPARTGQRVLLFLARGPSPSQIAVVDMRLIDSKGRVRRYFQVSNPGGLRAEGFPLTIIGVRPGPHGHFTGLLNAAEDDTQETKYPTLAEERRAIAAQWAAKRISH